MSHPEHHIVPKRKLWRFVVNIETLVSSAGLEVMGGVEWQFHQRPARKTVPAFPSMRGVRTLIVLTTKTVMLEVVHELEQVDGSDGLDEEANGQRPRQDRQRTDETGLKREHSFGVFRTGVEGSLDLFWDGAKDVPVHASPPWRGRWVSVLRPVSMMRMVVFGGEVSVDHRKEGDTGQPPRSRFRASMAEFMRCDNP